MNSPSPTARCSPGLWPSTRCRASRCSGSWTAISLAASLDAPFAPDEPLHDRITARMAMCHTRGFPNWRRGQPLRVRHEPGTAFRHSGEAYVFLQRVVERVTDTDLDSHLRPTLFGPPDMSASRLVWDEAHETNAEGGRALWQAMVAAISPP